MYIEQLNLNLNTMEELNEILVFIYFLLCGIILSYFMSNILSSGILSFILIPIFKFSFKTKFKKLISEVSEHKKIIGTIILTTFVIFILPFVLYDSLAAQLIFIIFSIFIFVIIIQLCKSAINITVALRYFRSTSISLLILLVGYLGAKLMIMQFNDDNWWFTEKTHIPISIGDWGDFATCLATIFALISISFAYRAFRSQVKAARRTSFDATFTQIFAQHKALHDKAANHKVYIGIWDRIICNIFNVSHNVFALCKEEYEKSNESVYMFWKKFNYDIGNEASIDLKNYFKYIYHEVNIVVSQSDDVLNGYTKQNYIQLIQAQMSYDELLCYLINQVEHFNYWRDNQERNREIYERAEIHAKNLHKYGFFQELCKSRSGHTDLVRKLIGTDANGRINDNDFIDESWFFHDS